ncbi:hypothetical protein [uncultured Lactobacillus sp.]|uniref:hypothetical protein n=1 Tax=uncultured Lactobacillus sp. TaxID=153152 RepID=UPI002639C34C|nr:hypothetical protein [uncultured Lactobacillus sp.]
MELLNLELLQRMIKKIVREVVREELKKRGNVIDQKMFNRKEAAKYLGFSGGTLDKAVRLGKLDPTFPFGDEGNKYYLREDLDQFAEESKRRYLEKAI